MTPGRTDLGVGLVLLGCFYGVSWMVRRLPRTQLDRMATAAVRTGHMVKVGTVGLARVAMAERELLDRARRVS